MVLTVLFILFSLPGSLAVLFYQNPHWLSGKMSNHGTFVMPSLQLESLNEVRKWQLLLVENQSCQQPCLLQLDKLARLKLALGRLSRQVDLRLMVFQPSFLPDEQTRQQMQDQAIFSQVLNQNEQLGLNQRQLKSGVYIGDPRGYLVFSYPLNTKQKLIYEDLHHLIKISQQ